MSNLEVVILGAMAVAGLGICAWIGASEARMLTLGYFLLALWRRLRRLEP